MSASYELWLKEVHSALASINMAMDEWQNVAPFDFAKEFEIGTPADTAAEKANRYWWRDQNRRIGQECRQNSECWLPNGHQGICQPLRLRDHVGKYPKGDHVKIEVRNERTGETEWLWLLVDHSDDDQRLVFGSIDNEPIVNTDMRLGQEVAVSYDKVHGHRKF